MLCFDLHLYLCPLYTAAAAFPDCVDAGLSLLVTGPAGTLCGGLID